MRRVSSLLAVLALVVSACAGPSLLVAGESIIEPEPPAPEVSLLVLAGDDLTPVTATLTAGGEAITTDDTGLGTVVWTEEPMPVTVSAPGFHDGSIVIEALPQRDESVEVRLDPVIVSGTVSGPDGRGLPGTTVTLGEVSTKTNVDGEFTLLRAQAGDLVVERPAWEPATVVWDSIVSTVAVELEPRLLHALRVGGDNSGAGDDAKWDELLELADATVVDAFVLDTKNEAGTVLRDTDVALAHEIGSVVEFYDLDEKIRDMDEHGLYKITRIVTFQDDRLAREHPELAAIDTSTGQPWINNKNYAWLDPTDPDSWELSLALAEEACRRGFDEIQFDYVRFPSDGNISTLQFDDFSWDDYYSAASVTKRVETIAAFLKEAYDRLNPMGCAVAADIFAITLESSDDEGIGQQPGALSESVDVLSPMIYTYTYRSGWMGFSNPNEHAREIVTTALDAGIPRLEGHSIYRPWLQRYLLEDNEIMELQSIAEERGLGWMLWSAGTVFDDGFLPPVETSTE